jgi:hypothetical protein
MHVTGRNLAFVLANTVAVMVALYIAVASDLERPYWAMFMVFIVVLLCPATSLWIGLVCAAVAHSVFLPQNLLEALTARIDRTPRRGGTWIADALAATQSIDLEAERPLAEPLPNAGKESDSTPGRVGQGSRQSLNPTRAGAFLNRLRCSRAVDNALEHTTMRSQHPGACGCSNRFRPSEVEVVPCDPWGRP